MFHKRYLPADYLKTLPEYPANPDGRALVRELRGEIQKIFASVGAIHMQVGKSYTYMEGRQPEAAARTARTEEDPRSPRSDEPGRTAALKRPGRL